MADTAAGKASFLEMVRYADTHDLCLMMLGVLGSFGDGMMQPLLMLVLGDIINSYGAAGSAGSAFSSSAVDKVGAKNILYCTTTPLSVSLLSQCVEFTLVCLSWSQFALRLLYVAVAVGACSFLGT